ncbi:MAG TPA: cytochrome P450 [Aestuariivirga sp.]|nr:cytochrome P450 [Aestuariivirga sp.]
MKELDARVGLVAQLLRTDVCALFYRLAQELPGQQVVLNLGREKLLVCQDRHSAQTILRENPDNFHKHFAAFTTFFGSSRLTADGDTWRKLHQIGQPLIASVESADLIRETEIQYARAASGILETAGNNPVVTIDRFIDHAAASLVMKKVLGVDISDIPSDFFDKIRTILSYCGKASMNYDLSLQPGSEEWVRVESALAEIKSTISALMAEGRKATRGRNPRLDAFYSALSSDSDLFGEFCALLFAGFDTTSSTLCWMVMLLASKPQLQLQLRRERREITDGKELSNSSLNSKTMMALINETFRLFPAVPILSRVAVGEAHVGGTRIRPGQKVLLSIIGLHHDRNFWSMPEKMDIGRFPHGDPIGELRKHLLPFSAGPRMCGGSKFAMLEIPIAIAALLDKIQFDAAEQQPIAFHWGASMRHRDGIKVVASHAG